MYVLVIAVILAVTAFKLLLRYLTYSRRNAPLPKSVKGIFDAEEYKKNHSYKMENLRFSIISDSIIGTIATLAIFVFNFHFIVYEFIIQHTANVYLTGIVIFLVPMLIIDIINTLMSIYSKFVIEAKYGFNKTTPATFIIDFVKSILITTILLAGLLSLFLLLHGVIGNWVFLAFFFIMFALRVFITFLSPYLIRIFEKLTPLEDGELKTKIEKMAAKHKFKLKGIYRVDASKRSTKLNAFAAGFGKTKTIGLFDTLIEKCTDDEILGVLAHEIGHAKLGHTLKSAPLSLLSITVLLIAAFFAVNTPAVSQAFGFADTNIAFALFIMIVLASPIMTILQIPANALSRKFEREADAFEKAEVGKEPAISAMKKIVKENMGNLTPHPFVVMVEHSHPPAHERIEAFEK